MLGRQKLGHQQHGNAGALTKCTCVVRICGRLSQKPSCWQALKRLGLFFFFSNKAKIHIMCSYLSLWLLGTISVKSSGAASHVTSYMDTDVRSAKCGQVEKLTGTEERLGGRWLFSPGPRSRETPGGSDGWHTAAAPRRCWTRVRAGCLLDGGNWQAPQTLMETLEKEAALLHRERKEAGQGSQTLGSCTWLMFKLETFPPAASSSSPDDDGVAAGVGFASSSVLHLLTLPNVILAFSTWNRGISARGRDNKVWSLLREHDWKRGGRSSSFRLLFSRSWTITLVYLFLLEIRVGISGSQSPAAVQSGNWSEPWGQWWGSPAPPGTRDAPRSSTEYLWTCINQGWIPNGDNPHPYFLRFTAVNFTFVFGCWVQWVGRCLCSQGQNPDQSIPLA